MAIWFYDEITPDKVNQVFGGTMPEFLSIECIEIGDDFLKMKMPVTNRSRQPYGMLHGGASAALAETIGSVCSYLTVDETQFYSVGLEINANHLRTVSDGEVIATCTPIHLGKSTQVWDIRIRDLQDRLICISRLTVAILPQRKNAPNLPKG